jgi:organic radical activating enzyme
MYKDIKSQLDSVGPGFCLAKWTNSTIHLGIGKTHSCHHCGVHSIPKEEIVVDVSALHNTAYKKQQRQLMLDGQRPKECDYCWNIEDSSDVYSDRILMSGKDDSWPYLEQIKHTDTFDPTYLEISFSNVCNMKCSYCGPSFSSQWYGEIAAHGPYPTSRGYNHIVDHQLKEHDNIYIEAFWKYLPTVYKNLHTLRITGGEPLLSKNTFRLLDYIIANPNEQLSLTVNTNLNVDETTVLDFINICKKLPIKKINIATSNESVGKKAEYARHGLNYQSWYDNCHRILDMSDKVNLHMMSAYNVLSVTSFTDFLKDVAELKKTYNRVFQSVAYVRDPDFMQASMLPTAWRPYLEESLSFIQREISEEAGDRFKHVIASFDNKQDCQRKAEDLVIFLKEHDQRRGTDFIQTFPEYSEVLNFYSK